MLSNFMNRQSGGRIDKKHQDEALQAIRDNDRTITVVDCGKDLDDSFVAELCNALRVNRFVTTLRIRDRVLGELVTEPLAKLVSKTTTLVTLKLSYTELTDDDLPFIIGPLMKNRSVQTLALDHNNITRGDNIVLLLQHNKTLDSLDVSFNNLCRDGDKAILAIADALGQNSSLKQLYLSGNGLSDVAARRLVEVVDSNVHHMRLRVLDIAAENAVRSETKEALKLVLEAAREAQKQRAVEDGDDLRSQLTGFGMRSTVTAPQVGGAAGVPGEVGDGISAADVEAWQQQVDVAAGNAAQFDEERKVLLETIEQLKEEKEQSTRAQIAALEQANKLQNQVAMLTERASGVQRDLDHITAKYDRKVKESADQLAALQTQLTAARKELVRQQDAAAEERARHMELQDNLTGELGTVHEQLRAATRAQDILEHVAPPSSRRAVCVDAEAMTDLAGTQVRAALAPAAAGKDNGRRGGKAASSSEPSAAGLGGTRSERDADAWSESTGDVSLQYGGPGRKPAATAPMPRPKAEWLDDDSAHDCKACRREFTLTRRKHHCRLCGHLFCSACCKVHPQWNMRACAYCVDTHS